MNLLQTIIELSALPGPSGAEGAAADHAAGLFGQVCDSVRRTRLGSVVGVKSAANNPGHAAFMLDAHIDEISLTVTGVTDGGFLRFGQMGFDPRTLPSREVTLISDKEYFGVITSLPPHVLSAEDMDKPFKEDDLVIDCGYSAAEAERRFPAGTRAVVRQQCRELLNGMLSGKALDNRAGLAVILYAAHLLKDGPLDFDLCLVASAGEEHGQYSGAVTAAYEIGPMAAIVVDMGYGRSPDSPAGKTFDVGGGPMIAVGPSLTRGMSDGLIKCAKKLDMAYQTEVIAGRSGTNAWPIQISRAGVPTGLVSVPLKYMHTAVEAVMISDIEQTGRLIAEFIRGYSPERGARYE